MKAWATLAFVGLIACLRAQTNPVVVVPPGAITPVLPAPPIVTTPVVPQVPATPVTPIDPTIVVQPSGTFNGVVNLTLEPLNNQDTRITVAAGQKINLSAPDFGAAGQYRWSRSGRNGDLPQLTRTLSFIATPADAAIYVCTYTLPDGTFKRSNYCVLGVAQVARTVAMSVRGNVPDGAGPGFIFGFAIASPEGSGRPFLVRAVGPTLVKYGIEHPLARPVIRIFQSGVNSYEPRGRAASASELASIGAAPTLDGTEDVSVITTFSPGVYTAHVSSADGKGGEVLLEFFEMP
jgi:hypothetical protein